MVGVETSTDFISIHAPERGRLKKRLGDTFILEISIHAPERGRLVIFGDKLFVEVDFNPRPREGATRTYCDLRR